MIAHIDMRCPHCHKKIGINIGEESDEVHCYLCKKLIHDKEAVRKIIASFREDVVVERKRIYIYMDSDTPAGYICKAITDDGEVIHSAIVEDENRVRFHMIYKAMAKYDERFGKNKWSARIIHNTEADPSFMAALEKVK